MCQSVIHERRMWWALFELLIFHVKPLDQHELHLLSDQEAALCGYTIQLNAVGDVELRTSFLSCYVYAEVDSFKILNFVTSGFSWNNKPSLYLCSADWHRLPPASLDCKPEDGGEGGSVPSTSQLLRPGEVEQQRDRLWGKIHGGKSFIHDSSSHPQVKTNSISERNFIVFVTE